MAQDNTVSVVGNLTREPELRFTPSGQATATFGIAVNRSWTDRQSQERRESTSFFDVVCWGSLAENAATSLTRGHSRRCHRSARPEVVGKPGGRAPVEGGNNRGRDRAESALGHGPGDQERTAKPGELQRRPADGPRAVLSTPPY